MNYPDYPIPDPAWDYAQIWHELQETKAQLNHVLTYLSTIENADSYVNETTKRHLDEIGQKLNSARRLIDS